MRNAAFGSGDLDVGSESAVGKVFGDSADRIMGGRADVDTPDSPRRRNRAAERRARGGREETGTTEQVPLYRGLRRGRSNLTIGTPDELGRSGLVSTSIADSDIKTPAAAAEHIRNGGSIEGVPRELILEAALKNSSADEKDESKLFRLVTVDEDGKPVPVENFFIFELEDAFSIAFLKLKKLQLCS